MTSVQRVPVIEEITLSDSDDEVHGLDDEKPQITATVCKNVNESTAMVINKFPSQNIKLTIEQVYLQGDFDVFDVPDSSDDEAIKNSKVNSTSNKSRHSNFMDRDGAETDDEQFCIDEEAKDSNTAYDEPIDLSLAREDERLSNISSSVMSPSSKSDDDKLSTVSSNVDTSKDALPSTSTKTDEEKLDNVFKEDMETGNTTSDDDMELADGDTQVITMPSRDDKQFRVRGKLHVETICSTCHIERRMSGKLWQNKVCRHCKENLLFQCANCKKRFASYHSTLCHLKKECMSQKFWSCPKCAYSVLEEKKLEEHIKKVHVDGVKRTKKAVTYVCDACKMRFNKRVNFEKHNCRHREIYRCQMCDYTNVARNLVKRHFTNSHVKGRWGNSKKFSEFISTIDTRPICVPDITSSSNVSNDAKRKTEEQVRSEEKRLNKSIALHCTKCSQNSKYSGAHVKKCENCEGSLLWQCITCKELSKSYCGIYAHLQSSCGVVFQSCPKCSKKFESEDDLEKHQHVCGQDLYLQCELCDYKTRIKGFFLKHVKAKHNLEGDDIRKWL